MIIASYSKYPVHYVYSNLTSKNKHLVTTAMSTQYWCDMATVMQGCSFYISTTSLQVRKCF